MRIKNFLFFICLIASGLSVSAIFPGQTQALVGGSFQPGRIMDDGIFYNGNSMSAPGIQAFLEAKVPVCDTWRPSTNPAYQPPFTCTRDFRQDVPAKAAEPGLCNGISAGNRSAAEIIFEVGQSCGVSQRALIVLLEKEQSLITDTWPFSIQFRSATGYGCPDTAPCDAEYYGFFNQVYNAARQFKRYAQTPNIWGYKAFRSNYIQYNPNASCGGSNVYIENQATAGLYIYTPYQPNAAALNNLYGTGDSCSAYGNRNFWRIHNNWFGPTISTDDYWNLVRHPTDGRYFVATNFAVHYIPNSQSLNDWGLGSSEPITVTTDYITSRTYGSPLNRLLRDKFGNIFLIDSGKKHFVRDIKYLANFGIDINSSIGVHGLSAYLPDANWLGYCVVSSSNNLNVWLINGVRRHQLATPEAQNSWGCFPSQSTVLSDGFINSFTNQGSAGRYITTTASRKGFLDRGTLWTSSDQTTVEYYIPSGQNFTQLNPLLEQLVPQKAPTIFAKDVSNGAWYLIGDARKHYIINSKIAELWGYGGSQGSINDFSSALLSTMTTSTALTPAAQSSSPTMYYLLGGSQKYYLPDAASIQEWLATGTSVPAMPNSLLNRYSTGASLSSPVGKSQFGDYFVAQDGKRLPLISLGLVDAWTGNGLSAINITNTLASSMPSLGAMPLSIRDVSGNFYYLESGVKHPINSTFVTSWNLSQAITMDTLTLNRYPNSAKQMKPFVRIGGKVYSVHGFTKTELIPEIYGLVGSTNIVDLGKDYFPLNQQKSSHLLRSTDPSDARLWLTAQNGKILLPDVAIAINLGYISKSIELTRLSPEAIDAIPTSPTPWSFVVKSPAGAMKVASFGEGIGFGNNDIAINYVALTNSVALVSQETFNKIGLSRSSTRLIRDDGGKIYWIDAGRKRWILNGAYLNSIFNGVSQTYLHGTVVNLIPNGPNIN